MFIHVRRVRLRCECNDLNPGVPGAGNAVGALPQWLIAGHRVAEPQVAGDAQSCPGSTDECVAGMAAHG